MHKLNKLITRKRIKSITSKHIKKLVIVAGMHRSGTSAYTGAIEGLGVKLGGALAAGHKNINKKGYKEDVALISLHEDLLWSYPSSWDDIFPLDLKNLAPPQIKKAKEHIRKILSGYFSSHKCCGLKDPRVCLFLPIWLDVCREDNIDVSFIIPFRDPNSVAKSLETRDGYLTERSLILWTKYLLAAEKYSRGYPRIILSYEKLLSDPAAVMSLILDRLNLPVKESRTDQIRNGASFITAKLNHSGHNDLPARAAPQFPWDLYSLLKEVDGAETGPEIYQRLDELHRSYLNFFDRLDPILVDQINAFKTHAAIYRSYWYDAMGSKTFKFSRIIRKLLRR